jgi:hypothetical protein
MQFRHARDLIAQFKLVPFVPLEFYTDTLSINPPSALLTSIPLHSL